MSKQQDSPNALNDPTQSSTRRPSEQAVSPALLLAAAQMSAHDSSESPEAQDHAEEEDTKDPAAKRQKRSRACQACRGMKIRCLPVEGQEACRACSKVNRACIMPGPARKRQKTVHKVAELEKKIDALTASLMAKNSGATAPTPPTESPSATSTTSKARQSVASRPDRVYSWDAIIEKAYPPLDAEPKPRPPEFDQDSTVEEYEDVISRDVIDEKTAHEIFNHWNNNMRPYSPVVAWPDHIGVDWLRKKRPMTLLSSFVVASGLVKPEISSEIAVEISRQLADRVMFFNEKSMDLVHAMLIYSTWYGKHKYAKDLGFNHYIHSCVAMCLDLGLGKRSRQQTYTDPEDAEARRTWMSCYFMAGNVATVLRLPPLVKFSPYLEECLEAMDNHPGAQPTDKVLCCLVRLTHLLQDVGLLFHMDDPGSSIPLNDSRTQYHLKMFEQQLAEWVSTTRPHMAKEILAQYEATVSLYIHEIALHNEHNVDDFRPMYRATGRETHVGKDFLTTAHFEAITACVDSMIKAIDAYLAMDIAMIRCTPALHTVWTAYVTVAMIRLQGILAVPNSKFGNIFLPKLNAIGYLDAIINKLTIVLRGINHPAENFVIAFKKLKAWHIHRTIQQQQASGNTSSQLAGVGAEQSARLEEAYAKAYNADVMTCATTQRPNPKSSINTAMNDQEGGISAEQQQQQQQQQYQQQLQQAAMPYPNPQFNQPLLQSNNPANINASSKLLDPNVAIDASTFDIQNWDFNVGELDNFETYLNDAGWMGYLM